MDICFKGIFCATVVGVTFFIIGAVFNHCVAFTVGIESLKAVAVIAIYAFMSIARVWMIVFVAALLMCVSYFGGIV